MHPKARDGRTSGHPGRPQWKRCVGEGEWTGEWTGESTGESTGEWTGEWTGESTGESTAGGRRVDGGSSGRASG